MRERAKIDKSVRRARAHAPHTRPHAPHSPLPVPPQRRFKRLACWHAAPGSACLTRIVCRSAHTNSTTTFHKPSPTTSELEPLAHRPQSFGALGARVCVCVAGTVWVCARSVCVGVHVRAAQTAPQRATRVKGFKQGNSGARSLVKAKTTKQKNKQFWVLSKCGPDNLAADVLKELLLLQQVVRR